MDKDCKGFLDDTSLSKTPISPTKTSTVAREIRKRNGNENREAFDSLYIQSDTFLNNQTGNELTDFPLVNKLLFTATNEVSFAGTEGANSSLGILSMDNLSAWNESAMNFPRENSKKGDKKLFKTQRMIDNDAQQNTDKILDYKSAEHNSHKIVLDGIHEEKNGCSSSSSDIEYDGTNIPELNSDFEAADADIKFHQSAFIDLIKPEMDTKQLHNGHKSDACTQRQSLPTRLPSKKEKSVYQRSFAFMVDSPEYKNIFEKLSEPMRTSSKADDFKDFFSPDGNPILDASSFNFDSVYGKEVTKTESLCLEPEIIKTHDSIFDKPTLDIPNLAKISFCPDEISARSSSLGSSLKNLSTPSESLLKTPTSEHSQLVTRSVQNEDSKDEVLAGSDKVKSMAFRTNIKIDGDAKDGTYVKPNGSGDDKKGLLNESESFGMAFNFSAIQGNRLSSLGMSENDFFSGEKAYEMLKQGEDSFNNRNMFQIPDGAKFSQQSRFSTSSLPNRNKSSLPTSFRESLPDSSNRNLSIGQFFKSKTEVLGTLSDDSNRERPYFGVDAQTPPRHRPSTNSRLETLTELKEISDDDTTISVSAQSSICQSNDNELINRSSISRILSETILDPAKAVGNFVANFNSKQDLIPDSLEIRTTSQCSSTFSNPSSLRCNVTRPTSSHLFPSIPHQASSVNTSAASGDFVTPDTRPCSSCSSYQGVTACNNKQIAVPLPIHQGLQRNFAGTGPVYFTSVMQAPLTIQGPTEINYVQVICVKDTESVALEIHSSAPCIFHLNILSVTIDEISVPLESSGVIFPEITYSDLNKTCTKIQLKLSPEYEGYTEVDIQTTASTSSQVGHGSTAKLKTKIRFQAEKPRLVLSGNAENKLDLGAVVAGSTVKTSLTLTNQGTASIPLRISIEGCEELSFTVGSEWKLLSPQLMQYRMPISAAKLLKIDIPVVLVTDNESSMDIKGVITASLDHPISGKVLSSIPFFCNIRSVKIVLKNQSEKILMLKAAIDKKSSQNLVLSNEGAIPVRVDLSMTNENNYFNVSPQTMELLPSQHYNIIISFQPTLTTSCRVMKSFLQAVAQPHGKIFTIIEVIGEMQLPHLNAACGTNELLSGNISRLENANLDSRDCTSSYILHCDKQHIEFGGVDVGEKLTKQIRIRNPLKETLKVVAIIKSNSRCFKFEDNSNQREKLFITLNPKEEKLLPIAYNPFAASSSSAILHLKAETASKQVPYSVTLSGYGGLGKVKLIGMQANEGLGWLLKISLSSAKETVYHHIKVHNVGCRASFVKLIFVPETDFQEGTKVFINPCDFVLLENESTKVFIAFNVCEVNGPVLHSHLGSIFMYSGDEIMRQKFRRKTFTSTNCETLGEPLRQINFNVPYTDEDKVPCDSSYPSSPKDCELFYRQLNKQIIYVCRGLENISFSEASFGGLPEIRETFDNCVFDSALTSRYSIAGGETPVKDSPKLSRMSLHVQNFKEDKFSGNPVFVLPKVFDSWTVKPDKIELDAENKDARIVLMNNSKIDMRFKLDWTVNVISVSPVQGIVYASDYIGLRVKILPNRLVQKQESSCFIKVYCNNTVKVVHVDVYKDSICAKTSNISLQSSVIDDETLKSMFITDFDECEAEEKPNIITIEDIRKFPSKISLQQSYVGVSTDTKLIVHNVTNNAIKWIFHSISSVSKQFPSNGDESLPIPAITVVPSTAVVQPAESSEVLIKFLPSCEGLLYQLFEIVTDSSDGSTAKQEIMIEGLAKEKSTTFLQGVDSGASSGDYSDPSVYADKEVLNFPLTAIGKTSKMQLSIKNPTNQNLKIAIAKPQGPFVIKHQAIDLKSLKFVTIQVHFRPVKPSSYESVLNLVSDAGHKMVVKLKGSCA